MDHLESYFLSYNKIIEDKLDVCIHSIESQLDKLFQLKTGHQYGPIQQHQKTTISKYGAKNPNPLSIATFSTFKAPYIRDSRGFSGPVNEDVRQIDELAGTEDIESLIRYKNWTKELKQQLKDAVLDHYARKHLGGLVKQKTLLNKQKQDNISPNISSDIDQKLNLIEEQTIQVKARKMLQIFVPEDRLDPDIDWCAISAKLADTHHDPRDCRLMWSNEVHLNVNNGLWTKEEDDCLISAVQKHGKNDWDAVAKELNSNRLPWQCCSRYQQEFANTMTGSANMTDDDKEKILEVINLCRIGNFVPWNQVMYFIKYHNLLQVKYQWSKLISQRQTNRPWSSQEDSTLLGLVEKFGDKDWNRIANYLPMRTNKSCRERYTMRLRFERRAIGKWRRREDENLLSAVERFGTNWSLISSHFPDRNSQQLRNRYELIKNEGHGRKVGPIKHKMLYRNTDGFVVSLRSRQAKPSSDQAVEERLKEIFSSFQCLKSSTKSLVCRSAQDDLIHQTLVRNLFHKVIDSETQQSLLATVLMKAIEQRVSSDGKLFTPCVSTIQGFKAWTSQQNYLDQFADQSLDLDSVTKSSEYIQLRKLIISLFLWPAILAKIEPPDITPQDLQQPSLVEKAPSCFYKIREIQKQLTSNCQNISEINM